MIRAIVFDFDGLILDTETPLIDAFGEVHRKRNMPFDRAKFMRSVGTVDQDFDPWKAFGPTAPRSELETERLRINQERLEQQKILPGVAELIAEARQRGLHLAVASNSSREHVDGYLKHLGLFEKFEFTSCRTDDTPPKPAPDLYLAVLKKLKVRGNEALALEDSQTGITSARAAGLWCVAVPNESTREQDFAQAHLRLDSLANQTLGTVFGGLRRGTRGGKP
ncbi:MAG TPA: HAD-IA family hydrolase [Opitutaceae bacterium]|jgi:HAD superfamily hydrolase (TIGR01509 family)|nr:HAD-IA family hydrolase [Opitutaceae bacterium]